MLDSFIPVALAVAPNPLGLPSHLKLTTIPIDAYTCFELWMPDAHRALLPEEAMMLRCDRARLEEICAKLTGLLGATLINDDAQFQPPTHRWQDIRRALYEAGEEFDAIAVTYQPQVIYPQPTREDGFTAWTLQQAGWGISFLTLQPTATGFRTNALPIKVAIVSGQSITQRPQSPPVTAAYAQRVKR